MLKQKENTKKMIELVACFEDLHDVWFSDENSDFNLVRNFEDLKKVHNKFFNKLNRHISNYTSGLKR